MSSINTHESDYLIELKGFSKDLEYLALAVKKSTEMFADNNDKYNYLSQKITSLEQSQERQEQLINKLKKVLLDSPESKQTGLLTEVRDLKNTFIDYTKQIEKERVEAKERAIEREKEKQKIEKEKELAKAEIENKKEKDFNKKMAVFMAAVAILAIFIPLLMDFFKGK